MIQGILRCPVEFLDAVRLRRRRPLARYAVSQGRQRHAVSCGAGSLAGHRIAADEAHFVRNARNKVVPREITPVFIGNDRGRSFFVRRADRTSFPGILVLGGNLRNLKQYMPVQTPGEIFGRETDKNLSEGLRVWEGIYGTQKTVYARTAPRRNFWERSG